MREFNIIVLLLVSFALYGIIEENSTLNFHKEVSQQHIKDINSL